MASNSPKKLAAGFFINSQQYFSRIHYNSTIFFRQDAIGDDCDNLGHATESNLVHAIESYLGHATENDLGHMKAEIFFAFYLLSL